MEELPAMTIKCDECRTGDAEYEFGEHDRFEVLAQCQGLPRVLESVQFRPGTFCDDCLVEWLLKESDRLYNREQTRWLYRQEATRRQVTNNPFHCSDCGRKQGVGIRRAWQGSTHRWSLLRLSLQPI
jgi:hypothetical protein